MKLFKRKSQANPKPESELQLVTVTVVDAELEKTSVDDTSVEDLEAVSSTSHEIKQQSAPKAILSGNKNIRALAENDLIISKVLKNILDWLLVVTSAETLRREEYEDLTMQMLKFDDDVTVQLEMQVKFKRAFEQLQAKQDEHSKMLHQLSALKKIVVASSLISIVSIIVAIAAIVV